MATRKSTKKDYKALHEGTNVDKTVAIEDDNENVEIVDTCATLAHECADLAKEEQRMELMLEREKRKARVEEMQRELEQLRLKHQVSAQTPAQTQPPTPTPGLTIDQLPLQPSTTTNPAANHMYGTTRMDLDPQVYLTRPIAGNKAKTIIDFIPRASTMNDQEVEIGNGEMLRLQGGTKPKLETITPAQWTAANARILAELIKEGQSSTQYTLDYLSYSAKIGELATRYTWSSVIAFDDEYRRRQAEFRFRWGSDSPHSSHLLLRERESAPQKPQTRCTKQTGKDTWRAASAMEKLPPEILTIIFVRVPGRDLVQNCRRVCKAWKQLVDGKTLWAQKCEYDYGQPASLFKSLRDAKTVCVYNPFGMKNLAYDMVVGLPFLSRVDDTVNFPGMAPGPFPGCTSVIPLTGHKCVEFGLSLLNCGLTQEFLDAVKPHITVSLWMGRKEHSTSTAMGVFNVGEEDDFYSRQSLQSRSDAHPATIVDSLKEDKQSFTFCHTVVESGGTWNEASYTFTNYKSGTHLVNTFVYVYCNRVECSKDPCDLKLRPGVRISMP